MTDPAMWSVIQTQAVPPAVARFLMKKPNAPKILRIGSVGLAQPMWKYNAERGFDTLTVVYLRKAFLEAKIPFKGPCPNNEAALVKGLVEHNLPDRDEAYWNSRVALHNKKLKHLVDTVLDPSDLREATDIMDPDDQNDFEDAMKSVIEAKQASGRSKSGGGGGSSKKSGPAVPLLKHVFVRDDLTVDWAMKFVPRVKDCWIRKVTTFHFRWQGHYPRPPPKIPP